jgi:hypothetical protein
MTDAQLYNLAKVLAVVLTLTSIGIAAAVNTADTGLSKQTIAWLNVVQAIISGALLVLPAVQHRAGDVRGARGR